MDRRVNACAHDWDHLAKRCRKCGLTKRRYYSSMPKQEAAAAHRRRQRSLDSMVRRRIAQEED